MSSLDKPAPRLTFVQWTVCVIASIGFAFDIYELLMLPLILRPALLDLAGVKPNTAEFEAWVGWLFFLPAMVGGIFGLLGGYLTDLWGRRRVLVGSILLYAVSACAAGFSTSIYMLLFLRCTTFVGVCVEFVAAVAWLAELFPDAKQREKVLGYTQAFSSFGGLLVTGVNYLAVHYGEQAGYLPAILGTHAAWRYTLISGLIPAIPLILIRPFLPESPAWAEKKKAGTLRRPGIGQLFAPDLRRTTIITTLMFACSYGAAFGALQHTPRIVPGLSQVKQETAKIPKLPEKKQYEQKVAAEVNGYQEIGGLVGRFILAILAVIIISRRALIRVFLIPGVFVLPLLYFYPANDNSVILTWWNSSRLGSHIPIPGNLEMLKWGIFVAGMLTIGQFSFWGNYLPRVYPLHLRGTGESFAANIGGRMIGTSMALVTTRLTVLMPDKSTALAAAVVALGVYLCGLILSFFLPEPKSGALLEDPAT